MNIIEVFDPAAREAGRFSGLPRTALVEDETARYLLADLPCPAGVWARAVTYRAVGIITDDRTFSIDEVDGLPKQDGFILAPSAVGVQVVRTRPYVNLHSHSEYSALDGLSRIQEMIDQALGDGQEYLALTDHGVCAGHLDLQQTCRKSDIRPLFGVEAYFVDDARVKDKDIRYWHLVLMARNQVGLTNLWRAVSTSNLPEHSYHKPRMDWRILEEYGEGLMATTACLRGPMSDQLLREDDEGAKRTLARMRSVFGDHVWLELHSNHIPEQRIINERLVSLGRETGTGLIVVNDSHYPCAEHKHVHKVWLASQTGNTLQDGTEIFTTNDDYHIHTGEESFEAIRYLGDDVAAEAVANTVEFAKLCDASIDPRHTTPVYHRREIKDSEAQGADLDYEFMRRICIEAMPRRFPVETETDQALAKVYRERFEMEMESFREKGFCGYHLIVWDYTNWCRDNGILLGPGRGSAAGSLVCFLLGITQVDPIEADLLFERYISPGRTSLPDIDLDFPASKRDAIIGYIVQRWGQEHVVRVGTVTRLRNKGVFKRVAAVLKGSPDEVAWEHQEAISKIIDEAESGTAGLGLSWDQLWNEVGDLLEPLRERYPAWFTYAEHLVGRLHTYGKHPAGIVIDTIERIIDRLPMRQGENEKYPVTEFPMDQLDVLGLVKFDILTLRTLDTIQVCMDMLEADPRFSGKVPHPHGWREEYRDPEVWESICSGDTLGIFQIETSAGTRLTRRIMPRSLGDLCAIGALNRPGPLRSGLADSYIARRDGREAVSFAHPLLEDVLSKTYGTMIYQEDIMRTVQTIAGYSSAEADEVRSILGKKKVDKIAAEGQRFVERCVDHGISQSLAEHMFGQMAEFSRYSFNKSHSWAYGVVGYWCAWFKVHFPAHFLVACLATADKDRFPEYLTLAKRLGYRIDLPDVNESAIDFSVSADGLGLRYGLSSILHLGTAAATAVIENRPYVSLEDFIERRGAKCNFGAVKTLAHIGALDSLIPEGSHRSQMEDVIEQMSTGKLERCRWLRPGCQVNQPSDQVCSFDWGSEPREIGPSGKPKKAKPPPKRCTKACRQYDPVSAIEWRDVPPLSRRQIRLRERDTLGLYVSSTPFDNLVLDGEGIAISLLADLEQADPGHYYVVGEIRSVRTRKDKYERHMGFLTILIPDGTLDCVAFSTEWEKFSPFFKPDVLALFSIHKNERGYQFVQMIPLKQE